MSGRPPRCAGALGVPPERLYADNGLGGTNRALPGLVQALEAARAGDTPVVPKPDRLARSAPAVRPIADGLVTRGVRLALGARVYDPAATVKMFSNTLVTFVELDSDLIRRRTREGMAIARRRSKPRGKQTKLTAAQQREVRRMDDAGKPFIGDLPELLSVSRPTTYRTLARSRPTTPASAPA